MYNISIIHISNRYKGDKILSTNVDYLIMGLLMNGDKSGYDIKKIIELSPVPSISSSCGSIYPAIKKLEKEEILEKHLIVQDGKPNKHLLLLTSKGKRTFIEWLSAPIPTENFSMSDDSFNQKFLFFSYLNENEVKVHCSEQIRATNTFIESIERFKLQYGSHLDKYALWNLKGSLDLLQCRLKWLNDILIDLKKE